ncbi:MAG: hypothetical protein DRI56_11795 [Chloroflexota bacterium]|nr:MAG: hypothetical protein DRI56_11795 [Chloroflexota bacterium]
MPEETHRKFATDWLTRIPIWVKGLAALVILTAMIVPLILSGIGGIHPTPNASLGDTWTRPTDNAEMIYVPAGEFMMGSGENDPYGRDDEKPQHKVTLDAFWIDKYEVTNAQYTAFLNAQGNQEEGGRTWLEIESEYCLIEEVEGQYQAKEGYANHPVVEVSWYGARAYAEWVGGRLPTEAEWEYAARGPEGSIYPWSNQRPTCKLAQYAGCSGDTISVGSLPDGANWVGAMDMAGNVWEWVNDWYGENYYSQSPSENPNGPTSGEDRVLRGGSFYGNAECMRCARRGGYYPDEGGSLIGFRVVTSP